MPADRLAFALWNASLNLCDAVVLHRSGRVVELELRGGGASLRRLILRRRD